MAGYETEVGRCSQDENASVDIAEPVYIFCREDKPNENLVACVCPIIFG